MNENNESTSVQISECQFSCCNMFFIENKKKMLHYAEMNNCVQEKKSWTQIGKVRGFQFSRKKIFLKKNEKLFLIKKFLRPRKKELDANRKSPEKNLFSTVFEKIDPQTFYVLSDTMFKKSTNFFYVFFNTVFKHSTNTMYWSINFKIPSSHVAMFII